MKHTIRQLAELLDAGLPLLAALALLADVDGIGLDRGSREPHRHSAQRPPQGVPQGSPRRPRKPARHWRHWVRRAQSSQAAIVDIREQVERGLPLATALQRHPRHFDAFAVQLISVGEATGKLAAMLFRLSDVVEQRARHRAALRQALVYPCFVCVVALGVCLSLMLWAVPTFQQLFDGFGAPLPALTLAVLHVSALLTTHGPLTLLTLALTGVAAHVTLKRRPALRDAVQTRLLHVPLVGPLRAKIALAHWASGLSTLLGAGIPLVDALSTLERVSGNPVFDRANAQLVTRLRRGEGLALAMHAAGCFPASVVQIIDIAEHAGALDRMVGDIGRRSAAEAQSRIGSYMRCVEPLVISLCGGFVAILVIALYLPIIELGNVV